MTRPERSAATAHVPLAVQRADRIPAARYHDPEFYRLECEKLWPRVWQMACRLEEIPKRGDYVVYDILEHSIIVTRVDENTVKAFHNHCRHRGVALAKDRGNRAGGIMCPFHGWSWHVDGRINHLYGEEFFDRGNLDPADLNLRECRIDFWGGCAFINLDDDAPPLRESLEPFATAMDAWHVESLRVEWWLSARLPVNWKLAMEAFQEGYHVMATHPQLLIPGSRPGKEQMYVRLPEEDVFSTRYLTLPKAPMPGEVASKDFIDLNIHFMKVLNEGMAGMTHAKDIAVAEQLRETDLPANPREADRTWRRTLHDAVMAAHKAQGMDIGDLHEVEALKAGLSVNFCFPHYFLLPTYGSASSYRIRPLGPEECLFELWSLTRFPEGETPPPIKTPTPMAFDDPRWPPIPAQDFANLPRQQKGLHSKGFEYMRLSDQMEGMISNNHRLIDGYLAGLDGATLARAAQQVSGPIDAPARDLGF